MADNENDFGSEFFDTLLHFVRGGVEQNLGMDRMLIKTFFQSSKFTKLMR